MGDFCKQKSKIKFKISNISSLIIREAYESLDIGIEYPRPAKYLINVFGFNFIKLEDEILEPLYYNIEESFYENYELFSKDVLIRKIDNLDAYYLVNVYSIENNCEYFKVMNKHRLTINLIDGSELYLYSKDYVQILRCIAWLEEEINLNNKFISLDEIQDKIDNGKF